MTILRSALFNLYFWIVTSGLLLAAVPMRMLDPRPVPVWAAEYSARWGRAILGGLRWICGVDCVVRGAANLPATGPIIIASQHQSAFDTLIWPLLVPGTCYVLKQDLLKLPLFGQMCRDAGMIGVDRGAGANALRSLLRGADKVVADGRPIVIFPEGTRVAPGAPVRLQPGVAALASRTGLAVVPVTTDSGLRWGRRAFTKRPGIIHIDIHPPLPPGLTRDEVMGRLEVIYRTGVQPVENSVGTSRDSLRVSGSLRS